jgi:hypothetical protein
MYSQYKGGEQHMTAKEQRISETIARLLPTLSEGQKDCFLAYAEGMAAALDTIKPRAT